MATCSCLSVSNSKSLITSSWLCVSAFELFKKQNTLLETPTIWLRTEKILVRSTRLCQTAKKSGCLNHGFNHVVANMTYTITDFQYGTDELGDRLFHSKDAICLFSVPIIYMKRNIIFPSTGVYLSI